MTVVIADISAASIDSAIEQITASVADASVVGQVTDVADEASVRDLHGRVYSELPLRVCHPLCRPPLAAGPVGGCGWPLCRASHSSCSARCP